MCPTISYGIRVGFCSRKSRYWPQGGNARPRHKPHPRWRGFSGRLAIEV